MSTKFQEVASSNHNSNHESLRLALSCALSSLEFRPFPIFNPFVQAHIHFSTLFQSSFISFKRTFCTFISPKFSSLSPPIFPNLRMQFQILSLFALFAAVIAQQGSGDNPFKIPPGGISFTAGQPATISWTPTTGGTVTLKLREGAASALNTGTTIESMPFLHLNPWAVGHELRLFCLQRVHYASLVPLAQRHSPQHNPNPPDTSCYVTLIPHLSTYSWYPQQWPVHFHPRCQHCARLRLHSRNYLRLRSEQEQLHTTVRNRFQEHSCLHHTQL